MYIGPCEAQRVQVLNMQVPLRGIYRDIYGYIYIYIYIDRGACRDV